jgi:hypothetical protein
MATCRGSGRAFTRASSSAIEVRSAMRARL